MTATFQKYLGAALLLFAAGFFIRSVQPAYAEKTENVQAPADVKKNEGSILYINIDSVNAKYHGFEDLYASAGEKLEAKAKSYQERSQIYAQRYDELYSNNGRNWKYSADSAVKMEEWLKQEETQLDLQQHSLAAMQEYAMMKNEEINDTVSSYMKRYAEENKVDYIFAVGAGSPIIYANDNLDVTNEIVLALNKEYDALKKNRKK